MTDVARDTASRLSFLDRVNEWRVCTPDGKHLSFNWTRAAHDRRNFSRPYWKAIPNIRGSPPRRSFSRLLGLELKAFKAPADTVVVDKVDTTPATN